MVEMGKDKEMICCECGCTMQQRHLKKHLTTYKHKMLMNGASMQDYHNMVGLKAGITDLRKWLDNEHDERLTNGYKKLLETNLKAKKDLETRYLTDTESEGSV